MPALPRFRPALRTLTALALAAAAGAATARADEGMWLLNKPPVEQMKSKYGFAPTPEWIDHVQKSCVRFSTGGSGSIISANGLVLTNHHVGSDQLIALSTPDHNLLETGFYARTHAEERQCEDLELDALWGIEDVTARVNAAVKPEMSAADANAARRRVISDIEKQVKDDTGLVGQVVTLYQGGRYHLYTYKRYTDIRLVWAPEQPIANFGGDTDNFEFPRYDLDACIFRIYENGQPLKPDQHLSWSAGGSTDGDLALIIGNPGTTRRLFTVDHLRFLRDAENPTALRRLWRAEVKLQGFAARSAENARLAEEDTAGVANSRKFYTGQLEGLQDPALFQRKEAAERQLRSAVDANPEYRAQWGDAWDQLAAAEKARLPWYDRWYAMARPGGGINGALFGHALTIVRLTDELSKPSGERLREYRDSNLESINRGLYAQTPIYDELEVFRIAQALAYLAEMFGADDPLVAQALAGKPPRERAEELVRGTTLKDKSARVALATGGAKAVHESTDPMIRLALLLDPEMRRLRQRYENEVEAVEREAYAKIAAAKFAIEGENTYPDATFTPRLTFGPVKGYTENSHEVKPYTTVAGLYERFQQRKGQPGFELPPSWLEHKDALDPKTPFNFVCAVDIIGGNSGSPVVNTKGEVIGLIFDGNLHSLIGGIEYNADRNRAVAVDSRIIIESLRKVYDAGALADEITGK